MKRSIALLKTGISMFCAALLASCGPAQNDPGPGGVTVGEAQALDEAAEMLDERNRPVTNPGEDTETAPQ